MKWIKARGVEVALCDPVVEDDDLLHSYQLKALHEFNQISDLVSSNYFSGMLYNDNLKVSLRDYFGND